MQERFVLKMPPPGHESGHWLGEDLRGLQDELNAGGIQAALRHLNHRVPYRFTAIYKFQGPTQRAVFIYDKHGEPTTHLNAIPVVDTFCQYVRVHHPFGVSNSAADERLAGHKNRDVIGSFYGVALARSETVLGSLCHFDFIPHALPSPHECAFMNRAKGLLLTRLNGFED